MIPGEIFTDDEAIMLNAGRKTEKLRVANTGDRPVQVGSHTHFFEVNKELKFEREKTYGFRLNIPAGTALRFEPGEAREVEVVELGGKQKVYGMNAMVNGRLSSKRLSALSKAKKTGYQS
jgi:urease subunit beta